MKYDAVIFDLDGTLLDTLEDLSGAVGYALSRFSFPALTTEQVRARIGDGAYKLLERCCPPGTDEATVKEALAMFVSYYKEHPAVNTVPYKGVPELLARLKAAGVPVAVASNKDDPFVKYLVNEFFPGLVVAACGKSDDRRRKPSPDIPNAAMAGLGIKAEKVLYVGDSLTDKLTAETCGFDFLFVPWGYGFADKILPAPTAKNPAHIGKIILGGT